MSILEKIVSLYAPHTCLGCGLEGLLLCEACGQKLTKPAQCCYRCRLPSRMGRTCQSCRRGSSLVSLNCAVTYTGLAKELIWSLKFDRAQAAADIMGRRMAQLYGVITPEDALIVPVPTAMKRVRKRGYDQAVLLARSYAKHTGCSYTSLLCRLGAKEQKGAGRSQRLDQLRDAFVVTSPQLVTGRRILLIDDVITTGATLEEATAVLRANGAKAVGALTFARA